MLHGKFALIIFHMEFSLENYKKAFVLSENVTIEEQLLPYKARWKFIQYMGNKPDKFEMKFWLPVDVEYKYYSIHSPI